MHREGCRIVLPGDETQWKRAQHDPASLSSDLALDPVEQARKLYRHRVPHDPVIDTEICVRQDVPKIVGINEGGDSLSQRGVLAHRGTSRLTQGNQVPFDADPGIFRGGVGCEIQGTDHLHDARPQPRVSRNQLIASCVIQLHPRRLDLLAEPVIIGPEPADRDKVNVTPEQGRELSTQ